MKSTRVRFAPSPTGPLHIGGLRTALFNYLYARKHNGTFILRVEDTDRNRYVEGSEKYILESLKWCGLQIDEGPETTNQSYGPYRQSERGKLYKKYAQKLIDSEKAYYAFDLPEALEKARAAAESRGTTFQYSAQNRHLFKNSLTLKPENIDSLLEKNAFVIRLKVPPAKTVTVFDEIRGTVSVNTETLDDKILVKSDGMPTYHFANVVDDHLMKISCVIRGEEWLPSLPLHKLIYDAFEWETPKFMHLPLILKPTGKGKLSKRDGEKAGFPVFPLNWKEELIGFKEKGFLPQGMLNYLALLGWNDGTEQEIFSLKELEEKFSVKGVQKGGARFDYEKALWINQQQLQKLSSENLMSRDDASLRLLLETYGRSKTIAIISLLKERLQTLADLEKELLPFLEHPKQYDEKVLNKLMSKNPQKIVDYLMQCLVAETIPETLKEDALAWAKEQDVGVGPLMQTLRMALVGKLSGPDIFEVLFLIGKTVTLERLKRISDHLKSN